MSSLTKKDTDFLNEIKKDKQIDSKNVETIVNGLLDQNSDDSEIEGFLGLMLTILQNVENICKQVMTVGITDDLIDKIRSSKEIDVSDVEEIRRGLNAIEYLITSELKVSFPWKKLIAGAGLVILAAIFIYIWNKPPEASLTEPQAENPIIQPVNKHYIPIVFEDFMDKGDESHTVPYTVEVEGERTLLSISNLGDETISKHNNNMPPYWDKRVVYTHQIKKHGELSVETYTRLHYDVYLYDPDKDLPTAYDPDEDLLTVYIAFVYNGDDFSDNDKKREKTLKGKDFSPKDGMICAEVDFPIGLKPEYTISKIHFMQTLRKASKNAKFYMGNIYFE